MSITSNGRSKRWNSATDGPWISSSRSAWGVNIRGPASSCTCSNAAAQSVHYLADEVRFPEKLAEGDIVFGTVKLVPTGRVRNIDYIIYVDPEKYMQNTDPFHKLEVGRLIGRINQRLEGKTFILMGPGHWGSNNPDLGVKVGYADIYNSARW